MIINKPINIDANNVSIGNVKIKWEVGKAYRTRGGFAAVMDRKDRDLVFLRATGASGGGVFFYVDEQSGKYEFGHNDFNIVGPWEDEA